MVGAVVHGRGGLPATARRRAPAGIDGRAQDERFLTRYFETRTLTPFAIYCLIAGTIALAWTALA